MKSKGLGDDIEKFTKFTGLSRNLLEFVELFMNLWKLVKKTSADTERRQEGEGMLRFDPPRFSF